MDILEIWKLNDTGIASILKANNLSLSLNRNYDKVLASTILYNEGKLDARSSEIVQMPIFNEMMSNTREYEFDLQQL